MRRRDFLRRGLTRAGVLGLGVLSGPFAPRTHWKQILFPIPRPFPVRAGKQIRVRIRPTRDPGAEGTLWRWSISDGDRTDEMEDFVHRAWVNRELPKGVVP